MSRSKKRAFGMRDSMNVSRPLRPSFGRNHAAQTGMVRGRVEILVVVYDTKELGIYSAPRVAWTMKIFGHDQVHVLNNFKLWCDEGYPLESGEIYSVECCPYQIPTMDESKIVERAHGGSVVLW